MNGSNDRAEGAPMLASTILLVRDGREGLEVFMVVRHREIDFASGALVFPGGRMETADVELARTLASDEAGDCSPARRAQLGLALPALGLRVAAIREAFEECGLLLARPRGGETLIPAERLEALDRRISFAGLMAREDLVLATDLLVPFAHWITPAFMPKRFDAHFFLALAPHDHVLAHDGREAVDSVWISPRRALNDARGGRFKLVFPTERNLWKLAQYSDAGSAIAAAKEAPIVAVQPERVEVDGGPGLKIPAAAGYGGELFSVRDLI
jgi:8-oxo-dGTP pyrophosphatase MutT (NUDIX family)